MRIRLLGEAHVREAVDMAGAVAAMGEAFRAISSGDAQVPLRAGLDTRHGVHLFMPAHVASTEATGVKVVSVCPGNASLGIPAIHAVVMVLEAATGRPLALMDGTYLTALRTGAASGFATGLLARESAGVVALFGAGVQARTQLEAVRCVRPVREVRVMSRRGESAERLVAELRGTGGETAVVARAVEHPREALAGADIVIAATDSATPVFPGDGVEEGAHVNGVGSYTPAMQEVDADLVARARVFVDQREAALAEAGDLIVPIRQGVVDASVIVGEVGEVALGRCPGRVSPDDVTFFKSVGNAVEDVVVAARVLAVAEERGLGTLVDL